MKYLLLIPLFLIGCRQSAEDIQVATTYKVCWGSEESWECEEFHEITINSCQYLVSWADRSRNTTHKGNCKNPIHRCQ